MSDSTKAVAVLVTVIVAVSVGLYASGALGDDSSKVACSSGQWVRATVVKANGEKLTAENRRQLPKGYNDTTSSGDQKLTINSDGSVTGEGGTFTAECITPTH